jgi:hypothetical protein
VDALRLDRIGRRQRARGIEVHPEDALLLHDAIGQRGVRRASERRVDVDGRDVRRLAAQDLVGHVHRAVVRLRQLEAVDLRRGQFLDVELLVDGDRDAEAVNRIGQIELVRPRRRLPAAEVEIATAVGEPIAQPSRMYWKSS